jgi:hypothetical protein
MTASVSKRLALGVAITCLMSAGTSAAAPAVAKVFGDHMVLQREMPVPVWGTAKPGEKITVTFRGQKVSTVAGTNGQWRVELAAMPGVKEPQELTVAGADKVFHWADAVIEGDTVVVSSATIPQPVAVRYAWSVNRAWANLFNMDGLPAQPFRTDAW